MAARGALRITNVTKRFTVTGTEVVALQDIDLDIAPGEFVAIVGASGCGKSTLLRAIVGLDLGYSGEIRLDGVKLGAPSLERAIVFQEHRLFPWLTAEQNVALGLLKASMSPEEKQRSIREHLELVGLATFAGAYPSQLSGGMAQRVAIARALVNRPQILLLDEPLGALDALTRTYLQNELRRIVKSEGLTAVLVTHDVEEAIYLGDRIVVMQKMPGRVSDVIAVPTGDWKSRLDPEFVRLRETILEKLGILGDTQQLPPDTPAPVLSSLMSPSASHA
jgi:sulfonate transport system ATP-binding protein